MDPWLLSAFLLAALLLGGFVAAAGGPRHLRRPRYRGIQCFFGLPGAGKSYELAAWALAEQARGRWVFTTPGFGPPGKFREFSSVEELLGIPDGSSIAIDEGQTWLDARAWQTMDPALLARLTETRKHDIQLRYTAMVPEMVETTLRRVTSEWWEVRPLAGLLNLKRPAKSPQGAAPIRDRNGRWRVVRMSPKVWDSFDTLATSDTSRWSQKRKSKVGAPVVPRDSGHAFEGAEVVGLDLQAVERESAA